MKLSKLILGVATSLSLMTSSSVFSAVKVNDAAPDFSLPASDGKTYKLSDFKKKYVVLEWHNEKCPYVEKHYNSKNMQNLQKTFKEKGYTWFTIISSAPATATSPAKQGYMDSKAANEYIKKMGASPTAILFDSDGKVGKALYGAKTTPHMFLINPEGKLIYAGAIDDKKSTDEKDIPGAKNYLVAAATEAESGKPVSVPSTPAYGCGIKYKD